jgi:hypothetical protein
MNVTVAAEKYSDGALEGEQQVVIGLCLIYLHAFKYYNHRIDSRRSFVILPYFRRRSTMTDFEAIYQKYLKEQKNEAEPRRLEMLERELIGTKLENTNPIFLLRKTVSSSSFISKIDFPSTIT